MPEASLSPQRALGIIFGTSLLYVAAISWGFQWYFYEHDFFYDLWHCTSSDLFAKDFSLRFHPVYFFAKKIQYALFGFHQTGYITTNLFFHAANTFFVFFLCRRFLADVFVSLCATLLFLTSFLSWGTLIAVTGLCRETGLFFYLLGILFFLRRLDKNPSGISFLSLICLTASLLAVEDGVTFPAILAAVVAWRPRPLAGVRRWNWGVSTTIFLSLMICAAFSLATLMAGGDDQCQLFYGWHSVQKVLSLPREILQNVFIPHRTWGLPDSLLIRSLPMILIVGCGTWFLFKGQSKHRTLTSNKPLIYFAIAWILITILPYLSRPSGWTWFNRYLYFPSVGIFMLIGLLVQCFHRSAAAVLSGRVLANALTGTILIYLMIFGTFSSILLWQRSCFKVEPTYTKERFEAERLFGLLNEIRSVYPAGLAPMQIVVTGSPLPRQRLQQLTRDVLNLGITIMEKPEEVSTKGPPAYTIAYSAGEWGKISALQQSSQ